MYGAGAVLLLLLPFLVPFLSRVTSRILLLPLLLLSQKASCLARLLLVLGIVPLFCHHVLLHHRLLQLLHLLPPPNATLQNSRTRPGANHGQGSANQGQDRRRGDARGRLRARTNIIIFDNNIFDDNIIIINNNNNNKNNKKGNSTIYKDKGAEGQPGKAGRWRGEEGGAAARSRGRA